MWQPVSILPKRGPEDSANRLPRKLAPLLEEGHVTTATKSHGTKNGRKAKIEAQKKTTSIKADRTTPTQVAKESPPSQKLPKTISSRDCPYAAGSNPASAYELCKNHRK